ncbi:LLM class flavin-dependent oxidoreductase [Candidatus Hecatella orcuttiae]|uniref:LLM class flavin-dependent oxidoreductase n=1 Tax=Candidatus Hecatella orcuttiae TaxID=1935119 RepID=UPI00286811AE|nr:LLM class flavin-dependent oxidoreductase [Candidatus Hecatella orcuttiae]
MKYCLNINANIPLSEVVKKAKEAERLGFECLWICDGVTQRFGPVAASAVAFHTGSVTVGLGLTPFIHSPRQIAAALLTLIRRYGERFELSLIPGDKKLLSQVGVQLAGVKAVPQRILEAKAEVEKILREKKVHCSIWVGAQGPKMLKAAALFDGVQLNFASPRMIRWGLEQLREAGMRKEFKVGVFAPAYVFEDFEEKLYKRMEKAASLVALGASKALMERFGFYERMRLLQAQNQGPEALNVPSDILEEFSISMPSQRLGDYIAQLAMLGVKYVVFAHPQDYSLKTIRELAEAIQKLTGSRQVK